MLIAIAGLAKKRNADVEIGSGIPFDPDGIIAVTFTRIENSE